MPAVVVVIAGHFLVGRRPRQAGARPSARPDAITWAAPPRAPAASSAPVSVTRAKVGGAACQPAVDGLARRLGPHAALVVVDRPLEQVVDEPWTRRAVREKSGSTNRAQAGRGSAK